VEAEALLDTLAYTRAEIEPEKFGDTLADVEGIAYTMRQLKAATLVDTLSNVKAEPLVAEMEAETLAPHWAMWSTESPVDTLADTCRGGGRYS